MREVDPTVSRRVSLSLIGQLGEQSRRWKGNKASYAAKHMWLTKHFWRAKHKSQALIYNNAIYFLVNGALITVWPVPGRFRKCLKDKVGKG